MNILALDTSARFGAVGLAKTGNDFMASPLLPTQPHSAFLVPTLDAFCTKNDLSLKEIDAFGVVLGPGSFTGLRIGLATVKGLAWSFKKPMVGLSSLEVLAHAYPEDGLMAPMMDARKGRVFAALYRKSGAVLQRLIPPADIDPFEFAQSIQGPFTSFGSGTRTFRSLLSDSSNIQFVPEQFDHPDGKILARMAVEKYKNNEILDMETAQPIYLRLSEAELHKNV